MKQLLKSLYELAPFKHQFFKLLKSFYTPSESIFKHLHFKGVIDLKVKDSSFKMNHHGYQIENEAFWLGVDNGWEKVSINLWKKLVEGSELILDIGANTGIYSLIAQAINKNAIIYAFEPVNRVYQKLQQNIALNNYKVDTNEVALSNTDGKATIFDPGGEHVLSVTVNKDLTSETRKTLPVEIDVMRLDTFIKKKKITRIDLMKIDVETHEAEVLEGMGTYLKEYQPTMLIEILNDEVGRNVENLLDGMNYLYFNLDEQNERIKKVAHITKSDYYNYLVCSEAVAKQLDLI